MARNVSVLSSDQNRVESNPIMSLEGAPSPRGDRVYVGRHQLTTVEFVAGDTPGVAKSFPVALDHVPSSAIPRSGVKTNGTHVGGTIEESHAVAWTGNLVWFISDVVPIRQEWLIL